MWWIKHGALRVRLPKFLPLYQLQAKRLAPTPDGASRINPPIPSSSDETALSHTLHGLPELPNRLGGLQGCPQWGLASFPALSLPHAPVHACCDQVQIIYLHLNPCLRICFWGMLINTEYYCIFPLWRQMEGRPCIFPCCETAEVW